MYITVDGLLKLCAGFTAVCVAAGWFIKIIRAAKKPADDIHDKLDRDNKRLIKLEDAFEFVAGSNTLIIKAIMLILEELERDNDATGRLSKAHDEMQNFILERK